MDSPKPLLVSRPQPLQRGSRCETSPTQRVVHGESESQSPAMTTATTAAAASVEGTALSSMHAAKKHREEFEKFVEESFVKQKKSRSKVITRSRGDKIVTCLKGLSAADAHFKFWVKSRGFRVMDYPTLGLKDVLCLPVKTKVLI